MKTLAVLMWKHLVVRRKRYIHTPIEIFSTIVFFVILYVFINDQSSSKADWSTSFSIRSTEPLSITSAEGPQRIFYTPRNNLTNLIMEKVGKRLSMQQQNVITDDMTFGKYYTALKNESDYQKYAYHDMPYDAVVIFQEISSTVPAKVGKLNYTIRMKGDLNMESYNAESPTEKFRPHSNYGTTYESFMKLQWAIDSSYLELVTGHDIPLKLTLQEFPYVKQRSSEMVVLVCAMMTLVCWLSLLLVFVFLVTRLAEERLNGIQELIRMVGVSQMLVNISHVLNVAPAGLVFSVVGTTLLTVSKQPMIPASNPIYIFVALALYFATVVSQAFAVSYLVRNQQYTVTIATVLYVAMELPMDFLKLWHKMPKALVIPSGLLPHIPLSWFWEELAAAEESGKGITMENFAKASSARSGSVLACYVMMMIQCAVFSMLTWYLSLVMPGPYGQALPWKFLCVRSKKKLPSEESEELEGDAINPHYFEAPPHNAVAGIKVANVSKKFGKHRALRNVSMDVYKGEITVLLGHNGAGKTTLMSIITGMYGATEGNVYVEGLDTVRKKDEMRQLLGLCPQHNLFFPDLTVLQHVMFFSMLKGIPYKQAKQSSMQLLQQVLIADKASFSSSQLSGGMKRRLQLACALAGNSRVLVLDEPTSGLDVETRRGLWDLLLSLRCCRTVLISTHFMEEAEALGDRVAALHAGRLRCHATTMYLKRALGTGYRLSLNTKGMPHEPAITAVVTSKVPDATVNEISLNSISYNLPSKGTAKFANLFNLLESKKSELGIENIGVGVSTLEEVFLRLGSDVTTSFSDEENRMISEPAYVKLSGIRLYTRQLLFLFQRQYKYILSKIVSFLAQQVAFPIIAISLLAIITNGGDTTTRSMNTPLSLELDMYNTPDRRVLYNVNSSEAILRSMGNKYPEVEFQGVPNIIDAILRSGKRSKQEYYKYLAGIEFNESDAKVLYTTLVRHAAPMALNLLSNMIATHMLPLSNGNTITTLNHPLGADLYMRSNKPSKSAENCIFWSIAIVYLCLITLISFVSLPCTERVSSTRRIHVMTGCPPVLHWTATLLTHFVLATTVLLTPAILSATFLDKDDTINQSDFLGVIALVIILGILSFLSLMYLVSFVFEERGATIVLVALGLIFCIMTPLLAIVHTLAPQKSKGLMYYSLILISFIVPPHTFQLAVYQSVITAKKNAILGPVDCYMCFKSFAPLSNILKLLVQFVSYMTIVVLTEHGVFNSIFDRIFNCRYKPVRSDAAYEMVRAEKAYVDRTITLPKQQIQDAMLASNLHKRYRSFCGKSFTAVRGVDFSVKRGECFGLLGVNGAGKSSTFKMLTGIECTTRGTIYADGHFISKFSSKYLQSLGYCPQFFGLDDFLSGHDNLTLLLTLRGLSPQNVRAEANTWIEIVGLEKYALRPVSGYSGGCARRLAAAAALSCGAAVTLLDEPTAGVDVAARRRVWAAVRRAIRSQRSIIITSHSLDEIEALCARIAIMVAGRIVTLGSAGALRAAHSSGHAVQLKLFAITGAEGTNSSQSDVERLKAAMENRFYCTLRDEHRTMLHYHINVTMRYSELFTAMEDLRAQFPNVLEDYTITETTLEEVFLSFAR